MLIYFFLNIVLSRSTGYDLFFAILYITAELSSIRENEPSGSVTAVVILVTTLGFVTVQVKESL